MCPSFYAHLIRLCFSLSSISLLSLLYLFRPFEGKHGRSAGKLSLRKVLKSNPSFPPPRSTVYRHVSLVPSQRRLFVPKNSRRKRIVRYSLLRLLLVSQLEHIALFRKQKFPLSKVNIKCSFPFSLTELKKIIHNVWDEELIAFSPCKTFIFSNSHIF